MCPNSGSGIVDIGYRRLQAYARGVGVAPEPPRFQMVAVMGVPGAGKTSLASSLRESLGGAVFAAGDVLRERAAQGDEHAAAKLRRGTPLSVPEHQELVAQAISEAKAAGKMLVLDGSPRHAAQAEGLAAFGCGITGIGLVVTEEMAYQRLVTRGAAGGRLDDSASLSRVRIHREAIELDGLWESFSGAGWPLRLVDASCLEDDVLDAAVSFLAAELPTAARITR